MPEEANEAPETVDTASGNADTTQEAGPREDTQQEVDYQKRYDDLRSEFDRRNQQWSKYEQDPAQFLRDQGVQFEEADDEEDEDGFDPEEDPVSYLDQRLSAIEQREAQEAEQAEQEELEEMEVRYISENLDSVLSEAKRSDLDQEDWNAIGDLSRVMRDEQGLPDVKGAYERLFGGVVSRERDRWVQSKRAPQAPSGRAGSSAPDLDNPQERDDYMAQRLAQLNEDT